VTTCFGLWTLGISLPIALGTIAGVLALVPYLGSVTAAVPAVLMAPTIDLDHVVHVVALSDGGAGIDLEYVAALGPAKTAKD
jgi:predicted PurR-regulated permease PerM